MLPEMLRVALSIGADRIRLATYSRKNKLYFAFRELGRVVRTAFLLDYIIGRRAPTDDSDGDEQKRGFQPFCAMGRVRRRPPAGGKHPR